MRYFSFVLKPGWVSSGVRTLWAVSSFNCRENGSLYLTVVIKRYVGLTVGFRDGHVVANIF